MKRTSLWILLISVLAAALSACSGGKHPAAASVEAFLDALVNKDEARMVTLTCQSYETDALLEYDAFSLVKTRLEGLDCQAASSDEDRATVSCQGTIIATYGSEDQNFELSERVYQVVNLGGDWLVCGN